MKETKFPFTHVEIWVIVLALENFPAEQVWSWDFAQWKDFYARIRLGRR